MFNVYVLTEFVFDIYLNSHQDEADVHYIDQDGVKDRSLLLLLLLVLVLVVVVY